MDFKEKCRELGEKRWAEAEKIESSEDFQKFATSTPKFPIEFCNDLSRCWDVNFEYYVEDFLSEVGFFTDMMGLQIKGFDEEYIMFKSPGDEFFFGFWASDDKVPATPKGALRMMFWVKNPVEVAKTLTERGIEFIDEIKPVQDGATFHQGKIISPNGVVIQIWGDTTMD